jgi:hypothetical protein
MANKSKVSVCFMVPVESASNTKEVKAAYKEIISQILKFGEACKADANVIMSHSVISEDPKDLKACAYNVADAKVAETQVINNKINKGLSSLDKPNQPETGIAEDDEDDTAEKPSELKPVAPTIPAVSVADKAAYEAVLISKFDRITAKTKDIIKFFVNNMNKEFSVQEVADGTGLSKTDVNAWLGVSGKRVKAIKNVKRGVYSFDPTMVKIKK